MQLLEFIKAQAEKLAAVPNAAEFAQKLVEAAKAEGYDLLANNVSDPQAPTYMPKHRFDEVVAKKNALEADIKTRDEQLADLGKKLKDNEPLANQVKEFQTANEALGKQLKDQALDFAIQRSLAGANAKFPELLTGKIDRTKLVMGADGQTVAGLDEQLTVLKTSYADLFTAPTPPPPAPTGNPTNPPAPAGAPKTLGEALAAKYGG